MFLSTYTNKIDAKGRVSVPSKYRNVLGTSMTIICWPSLSCSALDACGMDFLTKISDYIDSFPVFSKEKEQLSCAIMANMHELNIDQNGRIIIPEALLKFANIDGSITFVGQGSKFQIWNPIGAKSFMDESVIMGKSFNFFNKKDGS